MSSTYTPTAVALTPFTIPDDGDTIEAADVNVPIEAIADGVAFVTAKIQPATVIVPFNTYVGRSTTLDTASPAYSTSVTQRGYTSRDATPTIFSLLTATVNTAASSGYIYLLPLNAYLIDGATLSSAILRLSPSLSHTALPEMMPEFTISRTSRTGSAVSTDALLSTNNGWKVDPTATFAAFNAEHDVTFTPDQNNVIDLDAYVYNAFVHDEGGSHALALSTLKSVALNFTYP